MTEMQITLTEPAIAKATRAVAASGKRGELIDAKQSGLRLRVFPSGNRTWGLACRDQGGRMRSFTLGSFPVMGIAAAREAARVLHAKVRHAGADPVAKARQTRAHATDAKAGIGSLVSVLDIY